MLNEMEQSEPVALKSGLMECEGNVESRHRCKSASVQERMYVCVWVGLFISASNTTATTWRCISAGATKKIL